MQEQELARWRRSHNFGQDRKRPREPGYYKQMLRRQTKLRQLTVEVYEHDNS